MIRRWVPSWVWPLLILFAIGTVWLRLQIVRTTYAIDLADKEVRNLKQTREQMEVKVTAARSPRKLEAIAKTKFGLSQPSANQLIHLSSDSKQAAKRAESTR